MKQIILKMMITSIVAFGLSFILDGVQMKDFTTAIILAIVLSILNILVKPLLIIFTLPLTILTLGLFLFVINAIIISIADYFIDSLVITNFWWALLFSLLLSLVVSFLYQESTGREKREE
ncbi:phage holin family protein [Gynurincola endophyticus]|jgi:putative membrane protein|uniref:phage holin family protein n=1 Tax=Gynurincola endophyticus TaxID=2479004 RepID=UPI000F8DB1B3|nr:phage holin family protein [Gynurincola endophyticus]